MTRLTRRQFLGTTAAGALVAPHVWVRSACGPAEAALGSCAGATSSPPTTSGSTSSAQEWAAKNNVKVTIDHIPHLQPGRPRSRPRSPPSRATTSSSSRAPAPRSVAPALLDVQDLADKLGKKYGGWTPLAENYSQGQGRAIHSIPDFFIDFPGLYRKDLWTEIGMPNGPDSWEELHEGGPKLKAKGFPIGIGLAHHNDSRNSWRAISGATAPPRWPRTARR